MSRRRTLAKRRSLESRSTLLKPSDAARRRPLKAVKRDAFPGMFEVTKNAPQMAMTPLAQAFQTFFTRTAAYPEAELGAHARAVAIRWACGRRHHRAHGLSLVSECDRRDAPSAPCPKRKSWAQSKENQAVVGVDLKVSAWATLSSGENIVGPKAYAAAEKQRRRDSAQRTRAERHAHPRVGNPTENPTAHRPDACPDCESPHECLSLVDHDARRAISRHGHRGPQRGRDAKKSSSSAGHGLYRSSPPNRRPGGSAGNDRHPR